MNEQPLHPSQVTILERCCNDRSSPSMTITAPYPADMMETGSSIESIRNRERYMAQSAATKNGVVAEVPT